MKALQTHTPSTKSQNVLVDKILALILALATTGLHAAQTYAVQASAPAQERVFVCGHSFMIFTARLLPIMARAAHMSYAPAGSQMIGDSTVIQQWDLPDAKNAAKKALLDGHVDVLMLSPNIELPDAGIDHFTKMGLDKNPNLRVLVQASWPAFDDLPARAFKNAQRNDSTPESLSQMQDDFDKRYLSKLQTQVRSLNQSIGHDAVFIVPVSDAVFALRQHIAKGTAPGLTMQTDLFRDDIGHPKPVLAELVTYCHFAVIYQRSPVGLPVPDELRKLPQAKDLNQLLQQLAWEVVTSDPLSGVKADPPADPTHDASK